MGEGVFAKSAPSLHRPSPQKFPGGLKIEKQSPLVMDGKVVEVSEERKVVLLNTRTMEEVEVSVKLRELSDEDTLNIPADEVDAATVNAAAERARDDYDAKTGDSQLVVDIKRS